MDLSPCARDDGSYQYNISLDASTNIDEPHAKDTRVVYAWQFKTWTNNKRRERDNGDKLMRLTDDSDNRRLSVCLSITLSIRHGDIQGQIKRNGVLDITNKIMMDGGELYCMPDGRTTLKGK